MFANYVGALADICRKAHVSDQFGGAVEIEDALAWAIENARRAHTGGNKLIFAGNGGSAAIASHMATDYSKNGGLRSWAMNDCSMLTCLGNDFGYEHVFAKQIEFHARPGDFLIAISSSGQSQNILNAVAAGRDIGCVVMTLSGFTADNPLRQLGDLNIYLNANEYGFVEIGHLVFCHAVLDRSLEKATT